MDRPAAGTPIVHLYSICWNEAAMLPFFFRHYDPWVARYVFYDDGSTDGTQDMIRAHPRAELRRFERVVAESYVLSAQRLQEMMWQESRGAADWAVISAVDEHLCHPDITAYLRGCMSAGVTLVPALGYQMVAAEFPAPETLLCRTLTRGAPYEVMSKLSLFRPDALVATGFGPGRHKAEPVGELVLPEQDELRLLHYKYLGLGYSQARQALLATGLGTVDVANSFGTQYFRGDAGVARDLEQFTAASIDLAAVVPDERLTHRSRWWEAPVLQARREVVVPGQTAATRLVLVRAELLAARQALALAEAAAGERLAAAQAERDAAQAERDASQAECDVVRAELVQVAATAATDLTAARCEADAAHAALTAAATRLRGIESSLHWRLTRPSRRLLAHLPGLARRLRRVLRWCRRQWP
ncbi:MAG TPA: glycosyltransferase family 2 protein [Roseomonas sp.]|jgi:hypothetical protein